MEIYTHKTNIQKGDKEDKNNEKNEERNENVLNMYFYLVCSFLNSFYRLYLYNS